MQNGNANRMDGHDDTSQAAQRAAERVKLLIENLKSHVQEIKGYGKYYLAAKVDGFKVTARNIVIYAALGIVGLMAVSTLLIMSVVMLCIGFANLLTWAFNGNVWAGWLVAGGAILVGIALIMLLGVAVVMGKMKSATFKKYHDMRETQRGKFGHDVHSRAVQHAAEHSA